MSRALQPPASASPRAFLLAGFVSLLALLLLLPLRADEPTAAEKEAFGKYMDTLVPEVRRRVEASLAGMPPADRDLFIHRYAIAGPEMIRLDRLDLAYMTMEYLRLLDTSTTRYALDTKEPRGFHPTFADLKKYLDADTTLYSTGSDPLGNSFGPFTVGSKPRVPDGTFHALSDVADAAFWSPFK